MTDLEERLAAARQRIAALGLSDVWADETGPVQVQLLLDWWDNNVRLTDAPVDGLRTALGAHGWYVANVVTTAWVESSEWASVARAALAAETPRDIPLTAQIEAETALAQDRAALAAETPRVRP